MAGQSPWRKDLEFWKKKKTSVDSIIVGSNKLIVFVQKFLIYKQIAISLFCLYKWQLSLSKTIDRPMNWFFLQFFPDSMQFLF